MENTGKVKNRTMMTLAILFISALEMGGMGLQPALAAIQESFPDVPATVIQTMSNFPGFAMLIGCVISTLLATRFSKKVLCQFGVACYAAIAVLGFFFHSSIVLLFAWQIVLGLGFGFLMPTSNGIIAENYDEKQRGAIMGIQNTFTNGGGIYLTFVGGFLASIAWHYTYLAYLFGLIPLILGCIYLPKDTPALKADKKEGGGYLNVSKKTWMYGIIIFLFITSYTVFGSNVSFVISDRNLGSSAMAGTAMSIFLVGGMVAGPMFIPTEKKLHDYTFCIAFLLLTAGFLIVYFAQSLIVVFVGAIVTGLSMGFAMPTALLGCTNCNTVEAATAGCAVAHMAGQIGTVLSAIIYTSAAAIFSDASDFRFLFAAICCAVLCVLVALVVTVANRAKAK